MRIWIIGTNRLLGVVETDTGGPDGTPDMPESLLEKKANPSVKIVGDFLVCPLDEYRRGEMQMISVRSGTNLVVRQR